jgi:hypothetical protein
MIRVEKLKHQLELRNKDKDLDDPWMVFGGCCLFPTNIIDLRFEVIQHTQSPSVA